MAVGKLKFVRQGLMGRLFNKKVWIIEKSKISSIKFTEIGVTFCVVPGVERQILHSYLRCAVFGGFVPGMTGDYYV